MYCVLFCKECGSNELTLKRWITDKTAIVICLNCEDEKLIEGLAIGEKEGHVDHRNMLFKLPKLGGNSNG